MTAMKYLIIFACLTSATLALSRDEPSTKNTAPFDLIVQLARNNEASSVAALDSLEAPLQAGDLVDEIKKLIFEKAKEKFGNYSFVSKIPSPLPSLPPSFKEKKIGCKICTAVSRGVKAYIRKSDNYTLFENSIIKACHVLFNRTKIRTDVLCDGLIKLQLPHIYGVIKRLNVLQMSEFCPYLNACVPPKSTTSSSKYTETSKADAKSPDKKSKTEKSTNDVISVEPLRVLQLTDIHFEPNYQQDSNTDCGLPVCCLQKYGNGTAGYYGDYKCNIPERTIKNFLAKINEMKPDIILYSGDTPPHTMWDETFDSQLNCAKTLTDLIAATLPNTTVYPCIGNHEAYPTNLFSINFLNYTKNFTTEFFNYWDPIVNFPVDQKANIIGGGFYTVLLKNNLRLIVLNSNYWYVFNWYNVLNDLNQPKETSKMSSFLNSELAKARTAGEKVILMSHHVPGNADYIIKFSRALEKTIVEYSDIIALVPAGHTHLDEFRMMYNDKKEAKAVVLVSPSITTLNMRNPSMRVFQLDPDSYQLLDYEQFYLDLVQMNNQARENGPIEDITSYIKLLYSAKQAYSMPDLTPASWQDLTTRFESDHDLLLTHAYYSTAVGDQSDSICLTRCSQRYVCRMRNSNFDEFQSCVPNLPTLPPNFTMPTLPRFTLPHFTRPHFKMPVRSLPPNGGSSLRLKMLTWIAVFAVLYFF